MGDNATATPVSTPTPDHWTLIPEAIPIAVLLTGLLVAIVMITNHYFTARAERLREVCGSSSNSGSSVVVVNA